MARENQRVTLTKRLISEALLRLLEGKELRRITITELCQEAGINRVTFYRYYETPRQVLEEMCRSLFRQMMEQTRPLRSPQDFRGFIEDMCTFLYRRADVVRTLLRCGTDADAYAYVQEVRRAIPGKFDNVQSAFPPEDYEMMMTIACGGGYFLIRRWLMEDMDKSPREIADFIDRMIRRGYTLMATGGGNSRKL